ncbi:alpha/beta hydrolase [Photobacterium satsumensis]|uniref:alpha/beta hydrolase n=1 Tax=Photobacterium satsumensis TaxID=2910239 RepID=UPI003D0A38C8
MQSQSMRYSEREFEYYYLNSQQESDLPPVIFIHGILSCGRLFTHQLMPYFSTCGFSSYSLTLRGHGENTAKLSSRPFDDHIEDVAAFIEFVYQQEKKPAVVVGYSLGGLIAQHVCQREALGAKLAGMALMASVPPQGFGQLNQAMWFNNPVLSMVLGQVMAMPNMALLNPYYRYAIIDALFASKPSQQQLDTLLSELKAEDIRLFLEPHPVGDNFLQDIPVAVVGAKEDMLVPVSQVESTAEFYGVEPVFFSPMGHAMPVENDAVTLAAYLAKWCSTVVR